MKLWLIQNWITPYRIRLFEEIGKTTGVEFTLVLLCRGSNAYPQWSFSLTELPFNAIEVPGFQINVRRTDRIPINLALFSLMQRLKPDVVVSAGYSLATFQAALYREVSGKALIIWSEATASSERKFGPVRRLFRRELVRFSDAFIVAGELSKQYLKSLQPQPDGRPFFTSYNCSDGQFFWEAKQEAQRTGASWHEFRGRFPQKNILFVGQLIERKGVHQLIHAYRELVAQLDEPVGLIMLGVGELEGFVRACQLSLPYLFVEKFVAYHELPKYYAVSNVSILLSLADPNPLVVFESLYSGVPIVCSNRAGNCFDFIKDGENGWAVDPENMTAVVRGLRYFLGDQSPEKTADFCRRSVQRANYSDSAAAFVDAASHAILGRRLPSV
jgi:glycosyltransferase involved in cell wall biosynthesis